LNKFDHKAVVRLLTDRLTKIKNYFICQYR